MGSDQDRAEFEAWVRDSYQCESDVRWDEGPGVPDAPFIEQDGRFHSLADEVYPAFQAGKQAARADSARSAYNAQPEAAPGGVEELARVLHDWGAATGDDASVGWFAETWSQIPDHAKVPFRAIAAHVHTLIAAAAERAASFAWNRGFEYGGKPIEHQSRDGDHAAPDIAEAVQYATEGGGR